MCSEQRKCGTAFGIGKLRLGDQCRIGRSRDRSATLTRFAYWMHKSNGSQIGKEAAIFLQLHAVAVCWKH